MVVTWLPVLAAIVATPVVPATIVTRLAVLAAVIAGLLAGGENDPVSMATAVVTGLAVLASVIAGLDMMRSRGSGMCSRPEGDRSHGSSSQRESSE